MMFPFCAGSAAKLAGAELLLPRNPAQGDDHVERSTGRFSFNFIYPTAGNSPRARSLRRGEPRFFSSTTNPEAFMFNTEDREFIKQQVDRIVEAIKLAATSPTPSTSTPEPAPTAAADADAKSQGKRRPNRTPPMPDDARR